MKSWTITSAVFAGSIMSVCFLTLQASAQQAFSGLFQESQMSHISLYAVPWETLRDKNTQLAADGYELIDVESVVKSGKTEFYGIWRESNVAARLERVSGWENQVKLKQQMGAGGFVIQSLEAYKDGEGKDFFVSIWVPGKTEQKIIKATKWETLVQLNEALGKEFFQLTDIETLPEGGNATTFLAIYHKGAPTSHGYPLLFDSEEAFTQEKAKRNKSGFPLTDFETFEQGGKVYIAGLFKKDTYRENFRHRLDWTSFVDYQKSLGKGYYLTDLKISDGKGKALPEGDNIQAPANFVSDKSVAQLKSGKEE